jgi:5-methylcytosine-specific restriction endonuclease McrA
MHASHSHSHSLSALTDAELIARLPEVRRAERRAIAEVIATLGEVERRRLYLGEACSSMFAYCTERLGYSENEAHTRIAVARACLRYPEAMADLEAGVIHLTGLSLLAPRLTDHNASALLGEARGKSRREIEALLARWCPKSDVLPSITPLGPRTLLEQGAPGHAAGPVSGGAISREFEGSRARVEPLSAASFRVEFTASAALRDKLEQARNLLSHAEPRGDLAAVIERALDQLIAVETKRRSGAEKPRKHRETKSGSRHVPVAIQRAVRERDGHQCAFVGAEGRRCAAKRFLTIEHIEPFARGGPTTADNCCLLCSAHNSYRARQVFGGEHIREKVAEAGTRRARRAEARARRNEANASPAETDAVSETPAFPATRDCFEKVVAGLTGLGFARSDARRAVEEVRQRGVEPLPEPVLRAALSVLTPDRPGSSPRARV